MAAAAAEVVPPLQETEMYIIVHENSRLAPHTLENFEADANNYISLIQFVEWKKACLFGDVAAREAILAATTSADSVSASRRMVSMTKKQSLEWRQKHMQDAMKDAILAKCETYPDLADYLRFETGAKEFIYISVTDREWGTGSNDPTPRGKWKGINMLGKSISSARYALKTVDEIFIVEGEKGSKKTTIAKNLVKKYFCSSVDPRKRHKERPFTRLVDKDDDPSHICDVEFYLRGLESEWLADSQILDWYYYQSDPSSKFRKTIYNLAKEYTEPSAHGGKDYTWSRTIFENFSEYYKFDYSTVWIIDSIDAEEVDRFVTFYRQMRKQIRYSDVHMFMVLVVETKQDENRPYYEPAPSATVRTILRKDLK